MYHRLNFRAMGCDILAVVDQDSDSAPVALTQVPNWFEEWEQTLSRFRPDSELTRLNQTFDQPMPVSQTLWDVYATSQWAEQLTGGLVTPTVYDAVLGAGYDRSFDILPRYQNSGLMPMLTEISPLSLVIADKAAQTICLPKGVHLDFGGSAKGWAAHQAMKRLQVEGPALVNAAGDIAVSGPCSNGAAWEIGAKNPFEPEKYFDYLYLRGGGVATSGKDRRRWMQGSHLHHHIINPMTGQPVETNVLTATIIAPTVMYAEAAAKAALILGKEKGLEWIESDAALAGMLILDSGEVLYSQRMQEYL